MNLKKIKCSRYTDLDDKVISKASKLGLPLIGGTALEIWASELNISGVRKRSDNDLDFVTDKTSLEYLITDWCRENIDPGKVRVDIFKEQPQNLPKELIRKVHGVLVMDPIYLIWHKVQRATDKDKQDLKWLLSFVDIDELSYWLDADNLGITKDEEQLINSLL